MYKNRALVDRVLSAPPANDNMVMIYHRLVSLIEEYNRMARDKGLPTKNIPIYNNNVNYSLMVQSVASIFKDIDRVKNIKGEEDNSEDEEEQKTAINVEFTVGTIADLPTYAAWKEDGSLWYYIQDGDDIYVYADADAVITEMNGGTTLDLDYTDMPYELLVDKNGKEWKVNKYILDKYFPSPAGLFGYRLGHDNWNNNVIKKLTSVSLHNWTNKHVTDMRYIFSGCSKLTSLDLGYKFDTSSVTDMNSMFGACSSLTTLTLGTNFDTSSVTDMQYMFYECSSLTSLTLGNNFDTSSVTNMLYMFYDCSSLTSLDLGNNFDTSSVTNMLYMFSGCSSLTSLDLGDKFDTSKVTDMYHMFYGCSSLETLTLGDNFNTSSVTNMDSMFDFCSSLTSLDLGDNFNTSKVTDMQSMFGECQALATLTLGDNFNTSSVTNMDSMFDFCSSLTSLDLGDKFDTSSVPTMSGMFVGCSALESISLYKSAKSIIDQLPSSTWNINGTDNTVTVVQDSSATWDPPELPNSWGDEQWTLTRTIQQTS